MELQELEEMMKSEKEADKLIQEKIKSMNYEEVCELILECPILKEKHFFVYTKEEQKLLTEGIKSVMIKLYQVVTLQQEFNYNHLKKFILKRKEK